jgi:hypothetical protein
MIGESSTPQEQLLKDITSFLNEANIQYMVTGSVSVIRYGRQRTSHDIDFIIEANESDSKRIKEAFQSLPRKEFIVDPLYIVEAVNSAGQFNIFHLPTSLKLDFWLLQNTPFDKERFKRRKDIYVFDQRITFTSPEDTILQKFLWYKASKIEKHLIDAAFVYQIQKDNLDEVYLHEWAKKQNTTSLLNEIATMDLEEHY